MRQFSQRIRERETENAINDKGKFGVALPPGNEGVHDISDGNISRRHLLMVGFSLSWGTHNVPGTDETTPK